MDEKIVLALAGNPNAGKTTLFNALTGARQHVGNWPGVTVEKKEGTLKHSNREIHVVDLPGTYSLTAYSLEEIIARNFIVEGSPEIVLDVVDASNLERNLYLSVQLLEMGAKVVMALNMIDVAEGRKIRVDHSRLEELLSIPVIPTNGKKGVGISELLDRAVHEVEYSNDKPRSIIQYGTEIEEELSKVEEKLDRMIFRLGKLSNRWIAVKLLEGDSEIAKKLDGLEGRDRILAQVEQSRRHLTDIFADSPEILFTDARYGFISGAIKQSVHVETADRVHLSENIDKVLTNRVLGPVILLAVLYSVYLFTFQGSEPLVDSFETFFKWLGNLVSDAMPEGMLRSLIVSGIIDGVGGVLGFTPLIAFMFLAIAILEDTGYMARIAFMLDRVLRGFGLHGASMLALMVSGGIAGGCAVPGIMATRTMKEPKERLVTILVAPLMNCGAKLPVYALLIGAFFPGGKAQIMFLLTIVSWAMALTAAKIIRSTVLSGPSAPFVLELPPYRIPTLRGLLIHTWERTWMYVKKAGTVILAVSIIIWAMMTFPSLPAEQAKSFDQRISKLSSEFLALPTAHELFKTEGDLEDFEAFRKQLADGKAKDAENQKPEFLALAQALGYESKKLKIDDSRKAAMAQLADSYTRYAEEKNSLENEKQSAGLKHTLGGRIGVALEYVFKPMGFDWRTNVALVGGFAAKEVVVSTLGTAYSMGEVNRKEAVSLAERLKTEPGWNPLLALTLIVFVMLYNPCFTTLVVIGRESGKWRWSLFAMVYTTTLAYCMAFLVHSVGSLLKLGV
ncbi:MAG: ferrous iron transport protein B [Desulfomonile tiedjei]|uniref:Ferrous iron transport protein B n=1 Tax=Desulfomonile tiedjei TaxID=2358 RepID=A0A9D6V3A1_9BACT|nr:ferrous iron transport protein B [Desulfomonile tiedjei]